MRWTTKSTWIRIAVLFGIYLLLLAAWFSLSRVSDSMEIVKSLVFLILLAPVGCFLAPMYLFLYDSALIYAVGYSLLGFGAHSVGAFIHARRAR